MAATNDPHEALFLKFKALYTADSGGSGLNNASSTAYVQHFLRQWEVQSDGHPGIPRIEFEVVDDRDESPFGGDSPSCRVRLHLFTSNTEMAASGSAREQAVLLRMRTVFRSVKLSSQGGWDGGYTHWIRSPRAPAARPNENHRVAELTTKIGV